MTVTAFNAGLVLILLIEKKLGGYIYAGINKFFYWFYRSINAGQNS